MVAVPHLELQWLAADLHKLSDHQVYWSSPLVVFPVIGRFRVDGVGGLLPGRVAHERLEESRINILSRVVPGKRPNVVPESANCPPVGLLENNGRWAYPPLP